MYRARMQHSELAISLRLLRLRRDRPRRRASSVAKNFRRPMWLAM
jgi:hypothetical protein